MTRNRRKTVGWWCWGCMGQELGVRGGGGGKEITGWFTQCRSCRSGIRGDTWYISIFCISILSWVVLCFIIYVCYRECPKLVYVNIHRWMSTFTKYVGWKTEYFIALLYIRTFTGVCRHSQICFGGCPKQKSRTTSEWLWASQSALSVTLIYTKWILQ